MTLPYNKFDPDPWLRAEIAVTNLEAIVQRYRQIVRDLRAVRDEAAADRFDLMIAEWEVRAKRMRAELDAARYQNWVGRRAA